MVGWKSVYDFSFIKNELNRNRCVLFRFFAHFYYLLCCLKTSKWYCLFSAFTFIKILLSEPRNLPHFYHLLYCLKTSKWYCLFSVFTFKMTRSNFKNKIKFWNFRNLKSWYENWPRNDHFRISSQFMTKISLYTT